MLELRHFAALLLAASPLLAAADPGAPGAALAPALRAQPAPPEAGAAAASAEAAVASATEVVEGLHAALLDAMKSAERLGYQGRYQRLEPVIQRVFDLPFMAEKSVGRHWKTAAEEDQRQLVTTFSRFTVANFAGRFDGYSGQSFRTLATEASTHGTVLVRTRLDEPGDEGVALDYRLRSVGGAWRIIDIYLNGTVSELALRRSEYSSLIQREGFQALLARLDERIRDLASPGADQS